MRAIFVLIMIFVSAATALLATPGLDSINLKFIVHTLATAQTKDSIVGSQFTVFANGKFSIGGTYSKIGKAEMIQSPSLEITLSENDWRLNGEKFVNPRKISLTAPKGKIETQFRGIHRALDDGAEESITTGADIPTMAFKVEGVANQADRYSISLPDGTYTLTVDYYRANSQGTVLDPKTPTASRSIQFNLNKLHFPTD